MCQIPASIVYFEIDLGELNQQCIQYDMEKDTHFYGPGPLLRFSHQFIDEKTKKPLGPEHDQPIFVEVANYIGPIRCDLYLFWRKGEDESERIKRFTDPIRRGDFKIYALLHDGSKISFSGKNVTGIESM